jgi:hypothetical protein
MAFFGRNGDRGVRKLLLRCSRPLALLLSEKIQVAVLRPFGQLLLVLAGHEGDKTRNQANSAKCSVGKYDHKLQTVAGVKGDATRTSHGVFLAVLARYPR